MYKKTTKKQRKLILFRKNLIKLSVEKIERGDNISKKTWK